MACGSERGEQEEHGGGRGGGSHGRWRGSGFKMALSGFHMEADLRLSREWLLGLDDDCVDDDYR